MLKKKNLGQFSKLSLSSQKYGFGIQGPRSGIRKKPIPDPGVKKALDPGSGWATLMQTGSSETLIGWIWKNHLCPSMGPNGGSVAIDSVSCTKR